MVRSIELRSNSRKGNAQGCSIIMDVIHNVEIAPHDGHSVDPAGENIGTQCSHHEDGVSAGRFHGGRIGNFTLVVMAVDRVEKIV